MVIMPMMENQLQFVHWLRSVAPYIHAFRGKTFVVAFPGELVVAGALTVLAQDLSLLVALGIPNTAALEWAKEAAGELRLDIEAAFSQGLPNTPMSNAAIRIISGNFV